MQKRVVHLILAIIFLTTTIVQSFGSALAVAVNKETVTANTTSKIVNPRSAIEGASSVSESLASSLQSQSTSSASTSSDSKSSSKSSDSESSSSISEKKESVKSTTSKSVIIQPRYWLSDLTDPGSEYPDFSIPLSGQNNVTTIEDVANPVDGNGDQIEIPYPYNAFPVYIPGVSSETVHMPAIDEYGSLAGANLKYDENGLIKDNYIDYKKVMIYKDSAGKMHWIDMKQRFIGYEKHGWYNDAPAYLDNNFTSNSTGKNNLGTLINAWATTKIGKGTDNPGKAPGLLGITGTYDALNFFPTYIPNSNSVGDAAMRLPGCKLIPETTFKRGYNE
ncbi:MAG: hypothetical protein ACTIIU_08070 [Latilactobacillus curvatus]